MGEILNRYIFRETALTWLAVTGILLLVLLTDQFARVLDDAAGAKIPKDAILAVMGLSSIRYLTILVPVGIFLSIMLALARMYRDSEMAALMACGVGNGKLYRPVALLALLLAAFVGWLSLTAGPQAYSEVKRITDNARQNADLAMLTPGKFRALGSEKTIVYAEAVNEDGTLQNVFVQRRLKGRVMVVVAARAGQRNDPESGRKVLTFYDGVRYEGMPGARDFRVMEFDEHGIPIEISEAATERFRQETRPLGDLITDMTPAAIAELQWRVSSPLMLLILTLIAVPLSRAPPRTGRYNRLIGGVMVYISYSNLLSAAKIWVEQEKISPWLGVWWVHAAFIGLGLVLLLQQNGTFSRLFRRRRVAA